MTNQRLPLTVIAGFLGVGKTTAARALAAHRPPSMRWVVLVNEFGALGIDGAILDDGALIVLPGGCLRCAADAPLQITRAKTLQQLQPDRLLIEPTGMASAARQAETLASPIASTDGLPSPWSIPVS